MGLDATEIFKDHALITSREEKEDKVRPASTGEHRSSIEE